jgi:hypothetical protein
VGEPIPERLVIETSSLTLLHKRQRSGLLATVAFTLFILPAVGMMLAGGLFGVARPTGWGAMAGASWISAVAVALLALITRVNEMPRKGRLEIEDGELTVGWGNWQTRLPKGAVVGGSVTPRTGGALLLLGMADGRRAAAQVPSEDAGARALEALAIDPMGRALTATFRSGVLRVLAAFGVSFALILLGTWLTNADALGFVSGLTWLAICLALVVAWLVGTRPPEIAVGADGVRIRGIASTRFIPLAEIASARVEGFPSVLVITRGGGAEDRTRVPLGNGPMLAAVAHRIALARSATGADEASTTRLALLERGARSLDAWKSALRSTVARADYRQASLAHGDLARIVASGVASAEHRIGAALALRESGSDDARDEIRIAAGQCVDPRVRVALARIAEEDDDENAEGRAVEEALAATAKTRSL